VGLIKSLFKPQNNVTTSAGLDAWLRYGMNQATWSGISVTPENALHIAVFFAGVRVICEDIGKLPFIVYGEGSDGERKRAENSPFWRLIHDRFNSCLTSQQGREYVTACAIMRGNGCARKNILGGQVRELLPIHPDNVEIEQLPDWELVYHVRSHDGTVEHLSRKDVFHLPGLTIPGSRTPAIGVSVIEYARQTLGNALGANRQAGTFFGNGMRPSGILSHPGKTSKETKDRVVETLKEAAGGNNTNNLLFFDEGMTFTPVSLNARDSQFLESRTFEVLEICRWLRIKPHKVAELTRATFSNIEQESQEHVTDCLMPWGQRWQDAVNQQVIVTNAIKAEILYDALLRGTTIDRYNAYQVAAGGNAPFMTRNEIRRRENLPPLPGLDEMLVPLNMQGGDGGTDGTDSAA
jgi:HK97 family phage portal protein